MNPKIITLLNRIKRHILNANAPNAIMAFTFLTIFWFLFTLTYSVSVAYTEGVIIPTDKAFSDDAVSKIGSLIEQTKILASFIFVNGVLLGYQLYQRGCIKRIIKREQIDVIN